jgi:adenine-specific DNA glycosylase
VSRVAARLGYGEPHENFRRQARSVQEHLSGELPPSIDSYRRAFLYVSHHGAATCTEADPHCAVCPLVKDCPEGKRRTFNSTTPCGGAAS